jgi:hypothetical protein
MTSRIQITNSAQDTLVVIGPRRSGLSTVRFAVFIVFLLTAGLSLSAIIYDHRANTVTKTLFVTGALLMLAIISIVVLMNFVASMFAVERIRLTESTIVIEFQILLYRRKRSVEIGNVRDVLIQEVYRRTKGRSVMHRRIAFELTSGSAFLATNLTDSEAKGLIEGPFARLVAAERRVGSNA